MAHSVQDTNLSGTPLTRAPYEWQMWHRLGLGVAVLSQILVYGFTCVPVFTRCGDVVALVVLALCGEVADSGVWGDTLFATVALFKDPRGLPGPRFFVRVGKLLSEGSNTFLARCNKRTDFMIYRVMHADLNISQSSLAYICRPTHIWHLMSSY